MKVLSRQGQLPTQPRVVVCDFIFKSLRIDPRRPKVRTKSVTMRGYTITRYYEKTYGAILGVTDPQTHRALTCACTCVRAHARVCAHSIYIIWLQGYIVTIEILSNRIRVFGCNLFVTKCNRNQVFD